MDEGSDRQKNISSPDDHKMVAGKKSRGKNEPITTHVSIS